MLKGPRKLCFGTDGEEEYTRLGDRDDRKQLSTHQKLIALRGRTLAWCTHGPRFSLEKHIKRGKQPAIKLIIFHTWCLGKWGQKREEPFLKLHSKFMHLLIPRFLYRFKSAPSHAFPKDSLCTRCYFRDIKMPAL